MRQTILRLSAIAILTSLSAGCSSYMGARPMPFQRVDIVLKENDFKVTNANLKGKAECQYILGVPTGDPAVLSRAEKQVLDMAASDGKSIALVNWTVDDVVQNFFIFKKHSITLTAEAIEFTGEPVAP